MASTNCGYFPYSDPVAYVREVVKDMNRKAALEIEPVTISLNPKKHWRAGANQKNIGYAALCKLYYELGLEYCSSPNNPNT